MKTKQNKQKFKHGDKIKCIDEDNSLLAYGRVYTFDKYNGSMVMIQGTYDNGTEPECGEYEDNFELVKAVEPKEDRKKYTLVQFLRWWRSCWSYPAYQENQSKRYQKVSRKGRS